MIAAYITDQANKIARRKGKCRDMRIDLLRTYGIFCIVYAHCMDHGFRPGHMFTVSSVYVIQLFVFCAGYFYRDSDLPFGKFLCKKAKEYLLPYYVWNLVYGLISALLRVFGVIEYGKGLSLKTLILEPWSDGSQFYFNYASWFLLSLFVVVLLTEGIRRMIAKTAGLNRKSDYILLLVLFLFALGAMVLLGEEQYNYGLKVAVLRPLVLLPYYQLGYVYKNYWRRDGVSRGKLLWAAGLLTIHILLNLFFSPLGTKMVYGHFIGNPIVLMAAALSAVLLLAAIGGLVEKPLARVPVLSTVSRNTMSIMLHHMFVMFLIQFVFYCLGLPGFDGGRFRSSIWYDYTFGFEREWFILIYVAIAMAVPVVIHIIYEKIIVKLGQRIGCVHTSE